MEFIGYIGAVILIYSIITRNLLRATWSSFSGWLLLSIYGTALGSYTFLLLGIILALYNLYFILFIKFKKGEKFFKLLFDVPFNERITKEFISYHKKELEKLFPDFNFDKIKKKKAKDLQCCFIFRKLTPIGILIYEIISPDTAKVIIDYTEHNYGNLAEAHFLLRGKEYLKNNKGITKLVTYTAVPLHAKYLGRQGFIQDDKELFKFTLQI